MTLMVNKKYRGYGGSAGYPKLRGSGGGNVSKGWGSTKGGGSGGKPPSGCGKKIAESSLVLLAAGIISVQGFTVIFEHFFT